MGYLLLPTAPSIAQGKIPPGVALLPVPVLGTHQRAPLSQGEAIGAGSGWRGSSVAMTGPRFGAADLWAAIWAGSQVDGIAQRYQRYGADSISAAGVKRPHGSAPPRCVGGTAAGRGEPANRLLGG